MDILKKIEDIKREVRDKIAELKREEEVLKFKSKILGRKGKLTEILRKISEVKLEQRAVVGKVANEAKAYLEKLFENLLKEIARKATVENLLKEKIDVTIPGRAISIGRFHPISMVLSEIKDIFIRLGFEIEEGPDVELDFYNFEALNIPKDHPARDMQDTFYISEDIVLRTHTSPVQVRIMEKRKPPIKVIAPGTVYRCDSDISHSPMFHQVEGFMVGSDISFAHLKGILTIFVHQMFGEETDLRFRPSFFPFTEPSAEVDIKCVICKGIGCSVCSKSGWLEILGAGMIHPNVLKNVGYNPQEVTGFAFGLGIERIAMLKYQIADIRLFFENDINFLSQF